MWNTIELIALNITTHLEVFIYFLVLLAVAFTILVLPLLIIYYSIWRCVVWIRILSGTGYNIDMGSQSKKSSEPANLSKKRLEEMEGQLLAHSSAIEQISKDTSFATNDLSFKLHKLAAQAGFKWDDKQQGWVTESGILV